MAEPLADQKIGPTRGEYIDTLISVVRNKQKFLPANYYQTLEEGLRKVLGGDDGNDKFTYDTEHPEKEPNDAHQSEEADRVNSAIRTFLEPKLSATSDWSPGINEDEECRHIDYSTIFPDITLVDTEYRTPNHLERGITTVREIRRNDITRGK